MDKRHERHEIVPSVMKQKKNQNIYSMITDANSTHYSLFVFAFCFNTFSYTTVSTFDLQRHLHELWRHHKTLDGTSLYFRILSIHD